MTDSISNNVANYFNSTPRPIKLYNKIDNLEEFVVNNIIRFCDYCGTRYVKADVVRINTTEQNQKPESSIPPEKLEIVIVTCHNCGRQQALLISLLDKSVTKMDLFLDVPLYKLQRLAKMGPIRSKEALALHKYIQSLRSASDI